MVIVVCDDVENRCRARKARESEKRRKIDKLDAGGRRPQAAIASVTCTDAWDTRWSETRKRSLNAIFLHQAGSPGRTRSSLHARFMSPVNLMAVSPIVNGFPPFLIRIWCPHGSYPGISIRTEAFSLSIPGNAGRSASTSWDCTIHGHCSSSSRLIPSAGQSARSKQERNFDS